MNASVKPADRLYFLGLLALIIFGLIALASSSSPVGYAKFGDAYYFVKRQLIFGLLPGIFLFLLFGHLNYRYWRILGWVVYGISLLLLVSVFLPGVGLTINGSKSWIQIFGYSFQPSELAKLAVVMISAGLLSDIKDLKNIKEYLHYFIFLLPIFGLILAQPDVGTLTIIVIIVFAMLFIAGMPKIYLAMMGALGVAAFSLLLAIAPYRMDRLTTFLHPELDPQGVGYQINQAYLAIGSGGFWGFGLGHSRQKFQYLPEVQSDSVFAVIAEEMGFVVSVLVIGLITFIGLRGLKIAKYAPDEFGKLISVGVVAWFLWQSFLNISGIIGLLPLTGVPLPFVSHGGSAYMIMLAAMAVVANVSKQKS